MSFFAQAWIGIKKEIVAYKNNPKLLLGKSISIIVGVALTVISGKSNTATSSLQGSLVTNAISQIILFFMPARIILFRVSSERISNFKEYLMVNGMSKAAYQAELAVSNYFETFFYAIAQSLGIYFSYKFESSVAILQLFLIVFFGGIAVVNMALFLSTLMSPQTAPSIGSMLVLVCGLLYFIGTSMNSLVAYIAFAFQPTAGLALSVNALISADQLPSTYWDGFTGMIGLAVLAATSIIYLGLYLYQERDRDADLKAVEEGKRTNSITIPLMNETAPAVNDLERGTGDFNSALHYEKLNDTYKRVKTIEALHLVKSFPECTAVDDINFSIYEHEIFCLLGHNGAGKTTLVSLLTGLIPKTTGSFYCTDLIYNGEEIHSNLEKIRGSIGFCPQKDFLLMENTVYENLSFFAEIKKIPTNQADAEIERVMNKLGLTTFRDMPAKKLSGGFKRKLNIGIALLNDPKIIIMDEPTSGMDPVSRRNFWAIIKNLKNEDKTVVLTTQFIDEAEELSDRVAIMAKGKLFALGSSEFIKKKFGTGYNLIVQDMYECSVNIKSHASTISSKISSIIPAAYLNQNSAANVLQFTLPFSEQNKFSALFSELEQMPDIQINLQMVSLEEAFVSLGVNAEKAFKANPDEQETVEPQAHVPESFFKERASTFKDQLKAVLLERIYKVQKSKRFMFFSCFPLVFIIGGIVLGNDSSDPQGSFNLLITLIITGNAFLMNNFAIPVITERLNKITYVLKAMGLQPFPYWLGNLIIDMAVQAAMGLTIIASIYIFQVSYLQDNIGLFIAVYLTFSFYMTIFTYNISMTFDSVAVVMVAAPSWFLAGAFVPVLVEAVLYNYFGFQIMTVCYCLSFVFLGPSILLELGINAIVPKAYQGLYLTAFGPFSEAWPYILLSIGIGVLYFLKLLYMDSKIYELNEKKVFPEGEDSGVDAIAEEDDVTREKQRLISPVNQDLIKVVDVQKTYPNGFKALHDLSFGVGKGQIFCLLGPNGAGKTTSFEIITATIPKSSGTVQLGGKDLLRKNAEIFYETGMCSQSNTLWDYLTVEQHLNIYAQLKGLEGAERQEAVQYLAKALQLDEYLSRDADKLSGGNKRKLCVAISLIGAPKYIFLDEPSTGMDPIARSYLWNVIKDVMKGRQGAMVLTTHYMQEAELVGDKLGILVNGRFKTIGSLPELKKKFGEYSIVIYQAEDQQRRLPRGGLENIVRSVLPEARYCQSPEDRKIVFKVPPEAMAFGKIFLVLEEAKAQGKIGDFSIYTTTLEQIFLKLAKHQRRLTQS